jgi:hypothetical protein
MGLFGKSTPLPAPPELPVWLVRNPHDAVENGWVYYQVFRSPRDLVEGYGILPWDTLPGVEQTASDFMNRDHTMVEVIGVTAGEKWAEWNLPGPQPPVPGSQPDALSAPADRLEMMKLAVSLATEELLARQRDLVAFAQELAAIAAEKEADALV